MRAYSPRRLAIAAAVLALPGLLSGQGLVVAPKALRLLQVERGPLTWGTISIRSAGETPQTWTATASTGNPDDAWLSLGAAAGTTPASLLVGLVNWRGEQRKPGKYQGNIVIKSGATSATVAVEWEVRPAGAGATFSYLTPPNGCKKADGYPDLPICTPLPLPAEAAALEPGATYKDPNFGAKVRVMTGHPTYHTYATPSPLSAHNKYLMTYPEDGSFNVMDVASGRYILPHAPGNQSFFWDISDDEVYYYLAGAAIMKHDLRTHKNDVFIDYSKEPSFQFHQIQRGGTGDVSKDNWISFWAPDDKEICAVDLEHKKTYCADYSASQRKLPYGPIDFTLISKGVDRLSGKRYVMLIGPPAMGVFSVDLARGILKPEFRGPEDVERNVNHNGICEPGERCMVGSHLDTLEDSSGTQYLVMNDETTSPCEYVLSTYQLNKGTEMNRQVELGGGRKKVMTLWRCGPGWVDEHIGCARSAPYCVISTQNVPRNANDASPFVPTAHAGEIFVMRENGVEIRPLALSHSALFPGQGDPNYWSTPRAAISADGSLVVADSNFGVQTKGQRVTLIETGYPASKPAAAK
ncbi:MAG: hypothetical protein JWP63_4461 [Candidatus Solibacter sp.]|nr:hypothetical protein [Candidatus Solibacter sp.]